MAGSVPRSFRIEPVLLNALINIANAQNRSLNNLVTAILKEYIEEYELLSNPEFQKALSESENDEGTPWREAMGLV